MFMKGPDVEEFQLVADSVASLRNLVAKIAASLPPQDEAEPTSSQKNNVGRSYVYGCWRLVVIILFSLYFVSVVMAVFSNQ